MSDEQARAVEAVDASTVDAAEFARSIAGTPDEQLAEGMRSELRPQILDEVFRRMADHIRPERARGSDAVIHWRITGRPDGGEDHYEVVVQDGSCTLSEEPVKEPRITFTLDGVDFLKLVTGNANGPVLFTTGKLKIQGDIMLAARVAGMFSIPGT
jgi:putative sterol carrier protein